MEPFSKPFLPHALATHWAQYLTPSVNVVMSNAGVSYSHGNSLRQWQGAPVQSLIATGSALANNYTWQGFWHNQPVVSNANTGALYLYHDHTWISASALAGPTSQATAVWHHTTLWADGETGPVWSKDLTPCTLP